MRGYYTVSDAEKGVVREHGLHGNHVQPGARQLARSEGARQRLFVYEAAAATFAPIFPYPTTPNFLPYSSLVGQGK